MYCSWIPSEYRDNVGFKLLYYVCKLLYLYTMCILENKEFVHKWLCDATQTCIGYTMQYLYEQQQWQPIL